MTLKHTQNKNKHRNINHIGKTSKHFCFDEFIQINFIKLKFHQHTPINIDRLGIGTLI